MHARRRRRPPVRGVRQRGRRDGTGAAHALRRAAALDDHPGGHLCADRPQRVDVRRPDRIEGSGEIAHAVVARRRRRGAVSPGDLRVPALRGDAPVVQHVCAVCGGSAVGGIAGSAAVRRAVCTERARRCRRGLFVLTAERGDRGCVGRGVRPLRRHLRGGKATQPRRPRGCRPDRDQPGHHVRHPGDQLARASRRAGDRCAGRRCLCVRAAGAAEPGSGGSDGLRGGPVCGADLVAHKRSTRRSPPGISAWAEAHEVRAEGQRSGSSSSPALSQSARSAAAE